MICLVRCVLYNAGVHSVRREENVSTHWGPSPKPGPSEVMSDDVVHCVCGSDVDEGFMIQVLLC